MAVAKITESKLFKSGEPPVGEVHIREMGPFYLVWGSGVKHGIPTEVMAQLLQLFRSGEPLKRKKKKKRS